MDAQNPEQPQPTPEQQFEQALHKAQYDVQRYLTPMMAILGTAKNGAETALFALSALSPSEPGKAVTPLVEAVQQPNAPESLKQESIEDLQAREAYFRETERYQVYLTQKNGVDFFLAGIEDAARDGTELTDDQKQVLSATPQEVITRRCPSLAKDTYVRLTAHSEDSVNQAFQETQNIFWEDIARKDSVIHVGSIPNETDIEAGLKEYPDKNREEIKQRKTKYGTILYLKQPVQVDGQEVHWVHVVDTQDREATGRQHDVIAMRHDKNRVLEQIPGQQLAFDSAQYFRIRLATGENNIDLIKADNISLYPSPTESIIETADTIVDADVAAEAKPAETTPPTAEADDTTAQTIKTLEERQRYYTQNEAQITADLKNIDAAISGLSQDIRERGTGTAALNHADALRTLGPNASIVENMITPDDTGDTDLALIGVDLSRDAVLASPKLATELAHEIDALKRLMTDIPRDHLPEKYHALFDKIHPNGVPEGPPLPPLPLSDTERQAIYQQNKESFDTQLNEITVAVKELSRQIRNRGIGEAALNQANPIRNLGPKDQNLKDLAERGLRDYTTEAAIKAGDTLPLEAILASPKLSRELADYLKQLDGLVAQLPENVINKHFPALFQTTYPDGIPSRPVGTEPTGEIPAPGPQTPPTPEAAPSPVEITTGPNDETYPRWEDARQTVKRQDLLNDPIMEDAIKVIDNLQKRYPDLSRADLLTELEIRLRRVGHYAKQENIDGMYTALQESMRTTGKDQLTPDMLLAIDYLRDQDNRAHNQEVRDQITTPLQEYFKLKTNADYYDYTKANARSVDEDRKQGGHFIHDGEPMNTATPENIPHLTRDLLSAQLLADYVLDSYDPTARKRWAAARSPQEQAQALKEMRQYHQDLYTILTTPNTKLSSKFEGEKRPMVQAIMLKIHEFRTRQDLDFDRDYQGISTPDKDAYKNNLLMLATQNLTPTSPGDTLAMAVKGLGILNNRGVDIPSLDQDTTQTLLPELEEFPIKVLVQQSPTTTSSANNITSANSPFTTTTGGTPPVITPANGSGGTGGNPAENGGETGTGNGETPDTNESDTSNETETVTPLTSFTAAVSAVRGQLQVEISKKRFLRGDQSSELKKRELFEAEASRLADLHSKEARDKWQWDRREGRTVPEHISRGLRVHAERVWKATFGEGTHARKEKIHAEKVMLAAGVESGPSYFLTLKADTVARERIKVRRSGIGQRIRGGLRDFGNELAGRERELHRERIRVIEEWRANLFDPETPEELRSAVFGDYRTRAETAHRIADSLGDDFIEFAGGETGVSGITIDRTTTAEINGQTVNVGEEVHRFYNDQVFEEAIQWALLNDGDMPPNLELKLRQLENDFFLTPEFQAWRKSLTPEQQQAFDTSLSYGSTVIDRVKEILIPNVRVARNHYEGQDRVDLAITLNLGTAKLGANGEVPKKFWGEKRVAVNQEVMDLLISNQARTGSELQQFRADQNDIGTRQAFFKAFIQDYTSTAGLPLAVALTAQGVLSGARAGISKAGLTVPVFGGATVAVTNGIKRFLSYGRDRVELDREEAIGYSRLPDADRSREMSAKTYHKVEMGTRLNDLKRLTGELIAKPSRETAIQLLALIADSDARSRLGYNRGINLWQATIEAGSKQSPEAIFESQKTALPRENAKAKHALNSLDETIRKDIVTACGMTDESIEEIITSLVKAQEDMLYEGIIISPDQAAVLGSVSIEEAQSIHSRDKAFEKSQVIETVVYSAQSGVFAGAMGTGKVGIMAAAAGGIGLTTAVRTYRMLGRRPNPQGRLKRAWEATKIGSVTAAGTFTGGVAANELISLVISGGEAVASGDFEWRGALTRGLESGAGVEVSPPPALKQHELIQNRQFPDEWLLAQTSDNVTFDAASGHIEVVNASGDTIVSLTGPGGGPLPIDVTHPGGPLHPGFEGILEQNGLEVDTHDIALAAKPDHVVTVAGQNLTVPGNIEVTTQADGSLSIDLDLDPADANIPDVPDIHLADIPAGASTTDVVTTLDSLVIGGHEVDVTWGTETIINTSPATISTATDHPGGIVQINDFQGNPHSFHATIPTGTSLIADGSGNFDLVIDNLPAGHPDRILLDDLRFDNFDTTTGQLNLTPDIIQQVQDNHLDITYDTPQEIVTNRTPDTTVPGGVPEVDTTGMELSSYSRGIYLDNGTVGADGSEVNLRLGFHQNSDGSYTVSLAQLLDKNPTASSSSGHTANLIEEAQARNMHIIIGAPEEGVQVDLGALNADGTLTIPADHPHTRLFNPNAPDRSGWINGRYLATIIDRGAEPPLIVNSDVFQPVETIPGEDVISRFAPPRITITEAITTPVPESVTLDYDLVATIITHDTITPVVAESIFVPAGYRRPLEAPEYDKPNDENEIDDQPYYFTGTSDEDKPYVTITELDDGGYAYGESDSAKSSHESKRLQYNQALELTADSLITRGELLSDDKDKFVQEGMNLQQMYLLRNTDPNIVINNFIKAHNHTYLKTSPTTSQQHVKVTDSLKTRLDQLSVSLAVPDQVFVYFSDYLLNHSIDPESLSEDELKSYFLGFNSAYLISTS
jgi:hypothetical protein